MGSVYFITLLLLALSFITTKKTDRALNIFSFIMITIGVIFSYNIFVCYILTFFTIPITLLNLSIINIISAILLFIPTLINRKVQQYTFNKTDFMYIILLSVCTLVVAHLNTGFSSSIKYETGDPSVHYLTAEMFAESDSLLIKEQDPVHKSFATTKNMAYVNSGLIMKCLKNAINTFDNYHIFIGFSIFILIITAISMYTTISAFATNKKTKFLAFLVSLIYVMGYPLNSFLFGFEYLSIALFIICLIFDILHYFEAYEIKLSYFILILALLNFGLFNSYYMFVTFLYPAQWIYFSINSYKEKNKFRGVFSKRNISVLIITLLLPFLLGYVYYMEPQIYNTLSQNKQLSLEGTLGTSEYLVTKGFAVNGYIYVNLFSNMILLLPITLYLIYNKLKENKFPILTFIFCLCFILILLIGFAFGKVSAYYLSKNYFALWFILFYLNFKGIIEIYNKNSKISFSIISVYLILILINLTFTNTKIQHSVGRTNESLATIVEIFGVNKDIIKNHDIDLNNKQMQILKYFTNNIDYDKKVEFVCDMEQYFWTYSLTRYINNNDKSLDEQVAGQHLLELKCESTERNIDDAEYIVYFNEAKNYEQLKEKIFVQGNIIFENEVGGIIECTK